jgi:hypothetical protein
MEGGAVKPGRIMLIGPKGEIHVLPTGITFNGKELDPPADPDFCKALYANLDSMMKKILSLERQLYDEWDDKERAP